MTTMGDDSMVLVVKVMSFYLMKMMVMVQSLMNDLHDTASGTRTEKTCEIKGETGILRTGNQPSSLSLRLTCHLYQG